MIGRKQKEEVKKGPWRYVCARTTIAITIIQTKL